MKASERVEDILPTHNESPSRSPRTTQGNSTRQASVDSQHDFPTAVNTPWSHTPTGSIGNLVGYKQERADEAGLEDEVDLRQDVVEHGRDGHRQSRKDINGAEKITGADNKEMVLERKEMVDLGNGLEEVIVVEWEKDDPGVHDLRYTFRTLADCTLPEPVQLVNSHEIHSSPDCRVYHIRYIHELYFGRYHEHMGT
jgi:hypothetical protein